MGGCARTSWGRSYPVGVGVRRASESRYSIHTLCYRIHIRTPCTPLCAGVRRTSDCVRQTVSSDSAHTHTHTRQTVSSDSAHTHTHSSDSLVRLSHVFYRILSYMMTRIIYDSIQSFRTLHTSLETPVSETRHVTWTPVETNWISGAL